MTNTVPANKVPAVDYSREVTTDYESDFWAWYNTSDVLGAVSPWALVRVTGFRSIGPSGRWYAKFDHEGEMTFAQLRDLRLPGWTCPECGEVAVERPPVSMGLASLRSTKPHTFSHFDGEPLCPVVGADGYEPAQPV
jgi:hypothetical protein